MFGFGRFMKRYWSNIKINQAKLLEQIAGNQQILNNTITEIHQEIQSLGNELKAQQPGGQRLPKEMAARGLFIVSHGRSGSTILLESLNLSSKDVYILGEAAFYHNYKTSDFITRYNKVQKDHIDAWLESNKGPVATHIANPLTPKILFPTNISANPESFWAVLEALFLNYKYVGEKIAFGPWTENLICDRLKFIDFHLSFFPLATYICLFRNIDDVSLSTLKNFPVFQTRHKRWLLLASIALSYFVTINLYFSAPTAPIIQYEKISKDTFIKLSKILQTNVSSASEYYDFSVSRQHKATDDEIVTYAKYSTLKQLNMEIMGNIDHQELKFIDHRAALRHMRQAFALASYFESKAATDNEP